MRNSLSSQAIIFVTASIALLASTASASEPQVVMFEAADGFKLHADYYAPNPAAKTRDAGGEHKPGGHAGASRPPGTGPKTGKPAGDAGETAPARSGNAAHGAPFVILVHTIESDRKCWIDMVRPLNDAGFAVLALDLRGHGESATTDTQNRLRDRDPKLVRDMYDDLRGAYDWIALQPGIDRARFAIIGAEIGASIALDYAAHDKSVDAVVCISPAVRPLGMDTRGDMRQITGRKVLLLGGARDKDACAALEGICDGIRRKNCEDDTQGVQLLGSSSSVRDYVVDFLRQSVGEPAEDVVFASLTSNIYHPADSEWVQRIKPTNLRYFSSPQEAEARGLRLTRSKKADDAPAGESGGMSGRGSSGGKPESKPPTRSGSKPRTP